MNYRETISSKLDLIEVERPGRYVNGEWNAIYIKNPPQCKVCLVFPDSYEVAQSGLGIKILYHILNNAKGVNAQRCYAPLPDMEKYLKKHQIPLYTLEDGIPLRDMDILAFSLQYSLTYTNILTILDLSGIPFYSEEREEEDPIIITGGTAVFNPEPIAPFFDGIFVGEGEEAILEIVDKYKEGKKNGLSRKDIIMSLSQIKGMYIPALYKPEYERGIFKGVKPQKEGIPQRIVKRIVANLDDAPYPTSPVVPFLKTIHDRIMLEIFRGCTKGCRFCQAGFIYRPIRERSVKNIIKVARETISSTGYDELSLLSLSSTDYSQIDTLLKALKQTFEGTGVSISLPSLRLDSFSLDLVHLTTGSRRGSLTFAPEAGTQRLRDVINKNVAFEDFAKTLEKVKKLGWKQVKLYFMIGLPTETEEDLAGISDMAYFVLKKIRLKPTISVSHFVPQPFTTFQWEPMASVDSLKQKVKYLQKKLSHKRITFNWHDINMSFLEGVMARGDRTLSKVIERAYKLGCRFDGWSEHFQFKKWAEAFHKEGIDPNTFVKRREIDNPLPWEVIDAGIDRKFLISDLKRAYTGEKLKDCREGCTGCGVCPRFKVQNTFSPSQKIDIEEPLFPSNTLKKAKYHIKMSKTGTVRWISHLDFQKTIERALRRANIPVSYTQGFHPRPLVSLPIPLPLGHTSSCEWVEITLYKDIPPEKIKDALNLQMPKGIEVLKVEKVPLNSPSISNLSIKVKYTVKVYNSEVGEAKIKKSLKDFQSNGEILLRKKKGKVVNIKEYVSSVKILKYKPVVLEIVLVIKKSGSIKPENVVEVLLGSEFVRYSSFHRDEVYF